MSDTREFFRLIADHVPDLIMLVGRDERIKFINWTMPDNTVEQVIGTWVGDYVPPRFHELMKRCFAGVYATKRPGSYETEFVAADGKVSVWEVRVSPVVEGGEVTGLAIISSNVTGRRLVEVDRTRFFSVLRDLLCVVSLEGSIERVNDTMVDNLRYSEDDLRGRSLVEIGHPDDRQAVLAALARLRTGEPTCEFECRVQRSDGNYRALSWRAAAVPEAELVYLSGRDVTDERVLQAQVRQSQKMEAVGQLAGGVAHDFNNLSLIILLNAELALAKADTPAMRQHLSEMKVATQRAAELTAKLLSFSRHKTLHKSRTSCNRLVADVVQMLRRTIPANIYIEEVAGDIPAVACNVADIEQVLMNLCINARDAMPDGGRLTLRTRTEHLSSARVLGHDWMSPGTFVAIEVSDEGVGMAIEVCERIFEPFFTTKPAGLGTGLGLATAYGAVKQHGGILEVRSELGVGSTFVVYLPVSARKEPNKELDAVNGDVQGGKETILVAEDSEPVQRVVVRILRNAGYRVLVANDGAEALEEFERAPSKVDLALLDVVMPEMSGPEVAIALRRIAPELRILFTSGYRDAGETPMQADCIAKPYQPNTLLSRVRETLDNSVGDGAGE